MSTPTLFLMNNFGNDNGNILKGKKEREVQMRIQIMKALDKEYPMEIVLRNALIAGRSK
jgi:hypothetical protein